MIHKVSQVLQVMVKPDQLDWPKHLPMVEFTLNSSTSSSTDFVPFKLTYRYIPKAIQAIGTSEYTRVQDFTNNMRDLVIRAHNMLIKSHIWQTHNMNTQCQPDDLWLETGQHVYLSTKNLNLPKAQACKLMPKYIRPYEIILCNQEQSHYMLALPNKLLKCRIHPIFHS